MDLDNLTKELEATVDAEEKKVQHKTLAQVDAEFEAKEVEKKKELNPAAPQNSTDVKETAENNREALQKTQAANKANLDLFYDAKEEEPKEVLKPDDLAKSSAMESV